MPSFSTAGAVDLAQVKARAQAREEARSGEVSSYIEVSMANFDTEVAQRSVQVPVVVLVGSARSEESETLRTDLKSLAEASNLTFIVAYVDADSHPEIASALGVQMLPTVVALAAGRPVTSFQGTQPREALEQWTGALVSQIGPQLEGLGDASSAPAAAPTDDPRFTQATEALNNNDFDAAISVYDAIIADAQISKDVTAQAKQARITALLLQRLSSRTSDEDPIVRAAANPTDLPAAFDAADAEIIAGAPDKAFARLIDQLRQHSGDKKNAIRERLIELFSMFEPSDPRVLSARRDMASVLY